VLFGFHTISGGFQAPCLRSVASFRRNCFFAGNVGVLTVVHAVSVARQVPLDQAEKFISQRGAQYRRDSSPRRL
jgi:hypothetical protein